MANCYFRRINNQAELDSCLLALDLKEQDACYVQVGENDFRYIQKLKGKNEPTLLRLEIANNQRRRRRDLTNIDSSDSVMNTEFSCFLERITQNNGLMDDNALSEMSSWLLIDTQRNNSDTSSNDGSEDSHTTRASFSSHSNIHSQRELMADLNRQSHIHVTESVVKSYKALLKELFPSSKSPADDFSELLGKQKGQDVLNWTPEITTIIQRLLYPESFQTYEDCAEGLRFIHSVIEQIENEEFVEYKGTITQFSVPPFQKLFAPRQLDNDKILEAQKTRYQNVERLQTALQRIESDYAPFLTRDWISEPSVVTSSQHPDFSEKTSLPMPEKPRKQKQLKTAFLAGLFAMFGFTSAAMPEDNSDNRSDAIEILDERTDDNRKSDPDSDDNDTSMRSSIYIPQKKSKLTRISDSNTLDQEIIKALNSDIAWRGTTKRHYYFFTQEEKIGAANHLKTLIDNPETTSFPKDEKRKKRVIDAIDNGALGGKIKEQLDRWTEKKMTIREYIDSKLKQVPDLESKSLLCNKFTLT